MVATSISTFSWLFFIGLSLLLSGFFFKKYIVGVLGAFFLFLLGMYVLINPITGVQVWFSDVVGSVLFGVGAFIWVTSTLEEINAKD